MWDELWTNVNLATMVPGGERYGAIKSGAIAVEDGDIAWIGPSAELPDEAAKLAWSVMDGKGHWVTPGLIDCHTHIVHGGSRAGEFEMRLEGASYEEIARAGGGIVSTVKATRAASEQELLATAKRRARRLLSEGVTVLEVKSGYGLDLETELKMLRVARRLEQELPVTVRTTFLGAHALPPEYKDRADDYIDFVCAEVLPAVAGEGLADAVDAFCEGIGFTPEQTARVFDAARGLGLPVKLHADQLSDLGGAALAAGYKALSADHLEYTSEEGIAAMAASDTVAVLLPGAFYFLREKTLPPVESFRRHGVPIAFATDNNPGSSPALSLLLMLNMACTLFRVTPEEALAGVTRNAAKALGMAGRYGTLAVGKQADFVFWDVESPAELSYRLGDNPCKEVVRHGKTVWPV